MFYHGTNNPNLNLTLAGKHICVTQDQDAAAAYGEHVYILECPEGDYADEATVFEVAEELGCDEGERAYEYLDRRKVRDALAARGYVGADCEDCLPGTGGGYGEEHDCRFVFDSTRVTITGRA